jgi:hypothetical protein
MSPTERLEMLTAINHHIDLKVREASELIAVVTAQAVSQAVVNALAEPIQKFTRDLAAQLAALDDDDDDWWKRGEGDG